MSARNNILSFYDREQEKVQTTQNMHISLNRTSLMTHVTVWPIYLQKRQRMRNKKYIVKILMAFGIIFKSTT